MRRLLLIVLLCTAVDGIAAEKWASVKSKNFNLAGNASESQIRAVAEDLEQFRSGLAQIFTSSNKPSTIPTTVLVFKSDEVYTPFKPQVDNKPAQVTGYFQASEDVNYLAVINGVGVPRSVYHDYMHQIIRDLPAAVPLWFTEGAADFYSVFQIGKDRKLAVGQMIPEYTDILRKEALMPLDELFAVDRGSAHYNERSRKGMFYAESWALVNYLTVGVNGTRQQQLIRFLDMLAANKPVEESFNTAFEGDYKKLQSELQYYIRERTNWPTMTLNTRDKNEIDKELKARTLSEAETDYLAGDFLLHMNRFADAEAHLKEAIRLDPSLGVAQAAMGMLRFRYDDFPEALKYLQHALELEPGNYLVNYYYAFVLDKSSTTALDDLDAKRKALGKVVELAPQYVPAYEMMAYLNLTADLDYDGTLQLLQKARTYAPGNTNLLFLMAQVYVKKEEFDSAEKLLTALSNSTSADEPLRDGISNLRSYIARFRDAEKKRNEPEPETPVAPARVEPREAAAQPLPAAQPVPASPPARSSGRSGELVLENPAPPQETGTKVTGALVLIDCNKGMTLTVKAGTQTFKFHSDDPSRIKFVSFVKAVSNSISCGPVAGAGTPVTITYRPTPEGPATGEPLVVEFIEK